jgi:hypothetical protein
VTTNSQRALAASHAPPKSNNGVGEMPKHEQSISEQYRLIGLQWADAKAAFKLRDELKTTTLSKMTSKLMAERGQMAEATAVRIVKSTPEWEQYIRDMCADEHRADRLRVQMKSLEIADSERIDKNANARAERRL